MASYRPQLKTSNGLVDFPIDAETVKGKTILEQTYPVGAVYTSFDSTSPAALFGGTWQRVKDIFLLAAGDTYAAGAIGGEATHVLTLNEMPTHDHNNVSALGHSWGALFGSSSQRNTFANFGVNIDQINGNVYDSGAFGSYVLAGGGQAHNNMPPYTTVYMWQRIA